MNLELHIPGFDAQSLIALSPQDRRKLILERADFVVSSGPWISLAQSEPIFDAIDAGAGIGYNASPLFGVLHHPSAWSNDSSSTSFEELVPVFQRFLEHQKTSSRFGVSRIVNCLNQHATPRDRIRHYIAENIIDQFDDQVAILESTGTDLIRQKAKQIPGFDTAVCVQGQTMTVRFRENEADPCLALLSQRILAAPDAKGQVELKLPLSLSSVDFEFLIDRVAFVWEPNQKPALAFLGFDDDWGVLRDHRSQYMFHAHLLDYKRLLAEGANRAPELELDFLQSLLPPALASSDVVLVTSENWPSHRDAVERMQKLVYEPARQTAIEKFDALMADEYGFGLLVLADQEIAGMAFIGPLTLFPEERGTLDDPYRANRRTMYTLDLTIAPEFRGSLGKIMKQAITLMTAAEGHHAIHGRNRDHLARGMWAINLGLGSYELKRLLNDYPDDHQYRDCIYYRCPLRWSDSAPLPSNLQSPSVGYAQMARIVNG